MNDIKPLLCGLLTYAPFRREHRGGGTASARYCYAVWMRHLVMLAKNGLSTRPRVVAELGPGDSLGLGLCALLSGADEYYAFDVGTRAPTGKNRELLAELTGLFRARAGIPDEIEFPAIMPRLDAYSFPRHILPDEALDTNRGDISGRMRYFTPWNDNTVVKGESVDLVVCQAVLEHVRDLDYTYKSLYRWLKPGGVVSLLIDFSSHSVAREWNGHWRYSDMAWRVIRGRRPYLLNRAPHSRHLRLLRENGFEVVCDIKTTMRSGAQRKDLAREFKDMSDDDLSTGIAFIQAVKERR